MNHTTIATSANNYDKNQESMKYFNGSKWLLLALMMVLGNISLSGQAPVFSTMGNCLCSDDGPRVRDTVVFTSATPVAVTSYSGFSLPDSVLYHAPDNAISDDFYLSTDLPAKDTLEEISPGVWRFISYRNGNIAFPFVNFSNASGTTPVAFPACSATVPDAIAASPNDTICLSDAVISFTLPMLAGQISAANVKWDIIYGDSMTGSSSPVPMTGSMTTMFNPSFLAPGAYTVTVEGTTDSNCPIMSMDSIYVINDNYTINGFNFACAGDTVPFNIIADSDLALYDTIYWEVIAGPDPGATIVGDSTNVNNIQVRLDSAGTYTIMVTGMMTSGTMCSFTDTHMVTIASELDAGISGDTVLCINEVRTYHTNVLNLDTIKWTSTSGTIIGSNQLDSVTILFGAAGIDTIYASGETTMGCQVRDTFLVDIKDSDIFLSGDLLACVGDTLGYRAMYSDASIAAFDSLVWEVIPMDTNNIADIDTAMFPMDSLTVIWGAVGDYMIVVEGITDIGCNLLDTFMVNVQDTNHVILGPTLVCVGDPIEYKLVQGADSLSVADSNITWKVFRHIPGVMDVAEIITDTNGDDCFTHTFTTGTINDPIMYIVVAQGMTNNGCPVDDTLRIETIGLTDLSVSGPDSLCAGAFGTYYLNLADSLQNGPISWSGYRKSNGQPILPADIDQSRGDTAIFDFPLVADTIVIEVTGMAGPACTYTVMKEVILIDTFEIINGSNLDTLCLTSDSTWYVLNIDTAFLDLPSVTWSITDAATGSAVFPILTGSGSQLAISYTYPGPGKYTHRVRGTQQISGCEFDEMLMVTVKDTTYFIEGDDQVCLGDTMNFTEYVLLDANMMPVPDFTPGDSVNWVIGNTISSPVPIDDAMASMYIDSFKVFGAIGDTLHVYWNSSGSRALGVIDTTLCDCEINVIDTVLVRNNDFQLVGIDTLCFGDTTGYKITNFDGSDINDLVPASSQWTVQRGTVLNASPDSITVRWNVPGDYVYTQDTIFFNGLTNDSCEVADTFLVNIRSTDFIILGEDNVCQGEPVDLTLFNAFDSSTVDDIDSLFWVFSAGNDTIRLDSTHLNVFVDSDSVMQSMWTEVGLQTITAFGYTTDSCKVEATFRVMVNENPNPEIEGDLNTCINSTDIFSIDIDMSAIDTLKWRVIAFLPAPADGGEIVGGQGTKEVEIEWNSTGNYLIVVEGATNGGCFFTDSLQTAVIDAANAGQLACNNDINVTLPDNCELMLTPAQILQDPDPLIPDEQYEIIVEDAVSGQQLSSGLVDASLLGIQLKVIITHECSGQSCWGYITLEDKTIPELLCAADTIECTSSIDPQVLGFPVPNGTIVNRTSVNPPLYDVIGFEKCGTAVLTYEDDINREICDGDFGTIIYRKWKMTNHAGLMTMCTDTINILRMSIDSVDFSDLPDLEFDCHLVDLDDLAPGNLTGDLDLATGGFCFNLQSTYADSILPLCSESTFLIERYWTVLDWCEGRVRTHVQTIKVVDTIGPNITLASGDINLFATDHHCTGEYDLTPDIRITDLCSEPVTALVRIFENDQFGKLLYVINDGNYQGLAFDTSITKIFIFVNATDACGQSSQDSVTRNITVTDNIKPIPICDEETTISLQPVPDQPGLGWAIADWKAFDDGSWDNCGIEKIEIRKVAPDACGIPENNVFGEYLKFCCVEAMSGEEVMVELKVTDFSGNMNTCMVRVIIQDNSAISKQVNEGDFTISCQEPIDEYLIDDGSTVTFLTATCGIPMPPDLFLVDVDTSMCGAGTITRTWRITDDLGNTIGHEQIITRGFPGETFDPADLVNIWPPDYEGPGCAGPNTDPEALPEAFRPNIDLDAYPCSSLGLDHEDLIFRNVEGLCAKVLRTWTLYDWCQRDPTNPNSGKWEYVQILKLTDTVAPVIITGCDSETFTATNPNNCSADISISATADDCHDTDDLAWTYQITNFTGSTVLTGNKNTINTSLTVGLYTVTWTATDPCGNTTSCNKDVQVFDGVDPDVDFRNISRLINAQGTTVNANELVAQVQDNCSDAGGITFHFDAIDGPSSKDFTCDDMLGGDSRAINVNIYVVDESGNSSTGTATITLEDTNDACPNSDGAGIVAGEVFTEKNFTVDEVAVKLTSMNSGASALAKTPLQGNYRFDEVPMSDTYELTAHRDDKYTNGVSTLDLLLIQRHILGLLTLDSPYKVIAADVDGSGHVSAIDLVHLRRLILGQSNDIPLGQSWTFVDAAQTFADATSPFPYKQVLTLDNLNEDHLDMNFIGVKMGDVNGNVLLQSVLLGITRSVESIEVSEIQRNGREVVVGLKPNDVALLAGMQLSLGLNEGVSVDRIYSDQINITGDNYAIIDNELRISWNSISAMETTEEALIYIALSTEQEDMSIEELLTLSGDHLISELYTEEAGTVVANDVFLEFSQSSTEKLILEQNIPNPFNGLTSIRFYQPQNGEIAFRVTDLAGRVLMRQIDNYSKGWHEINVSTDDLPGSGIYIYELSNGSEIFRKKMITIE